MTTPWRKVLRDVWRERTRALLVVLAMAIGLAGFLAVLASYGVLRREIRDGYAATNPASATLTTDVVDGAAVQAVAARPGIAVAEAGRVIRARIHVGGGRTKRLLLFVVPDIAGQRLNIADREDNGGPLQPGDVLIERDAFQVARARVGDRVSVELIPGDVRMLRVAGTVHDFGQTQARMDQQVYGYITPATLPWLGLPPTLDRLAIVVTGDRFDDAHVRAVAAEAKTVLEAAGHPVSRVDIPPPGQHPHELIMRLLLLTMAAFGAVVLVLSATIVSNLVLALMAHERRQLGVMHAIGATRGQIARIYLAEAALLGSVAILVALPGGLVVEGALTTYLAALLNLDIVNAAIPLWVYALVVVTGVAVPVVAAARPVARATKQAARATLADSGVDPLAFGTDPLDRALSRVGGNARPLLLGVRNSLRRRGRTLTTIATLAVAGASVIAAVSTRRSVMSSIDAAASAGAFGSEGRYALDQHMVMVFAFLLIVAGIIGTVGALGLMTTTSLNVLDRRRELGVLRAVGATPATVAGLIVVETLSVVLVSWIAAVALAWPITAGIGRLFSALFSLLKGRFVVHLDATIVVAWLGIAIAVGAIASAGPAWQAARRSIREAISYE